MNKLGEDLAALAVAATAGEQLCRDDLAHLRRGIFDALDLHRGIVAGTGLITAPGLLRDAPRWLEWWWTTANGSPEALRVNLDPSAPDFYDYTAEDWYATPERTHAQWIAGPYVDYACTNEYTITLSTPVLLVDELIGVAAADILLANLESQLLPVLMAIDSPVALVNGDGRIIASNSPQWAPGLRLGSGRPPPGDVGQGESGSASLRSWSASWVLVDVGDTLPLASHRSGFEDV